MGTREHMDHRKEALETQKSNKQKKTNSIIQIPKQNNQTYFIIVVHLQL